MLNINITTKLINLSGVLNTIEKLIPLEGEKHFYEDELKQIEIDKQDALAKRMKQPQPITQ